MQGTTLLRSLRSVRRFSPEPIPGDVLHDILEVARWTGSGKNAQPWEVIVIEDRDTLRELSTLGQYADHLAGATMAIVLVMDPAAGSSEFDAGRLAQNIMLAAWAHGIGSCIATVYPEDSVRALLDVPDNRSVRTAISLGYPAAPTATRLSGSPEHVRSAVRAGRRPLHETVNWERYGRRSR